MTERKPESVPNDSSDWFDYGFGYALDIITDELVKEIDTAVEKAVKEYFDRKRKEYVR